MKKLNLSKKSLVVITAVVATIFLVAAYPVYRYLFTPYYNQKVLTESLKNLSSSETVFEFTIDSQYEEKYSDNTEDQEIKLDGYVKFDKEGNIFIDDATLATEDGTLEFSQFVYTKTGEESYAAYKDFNELLISDRKYKLIDTTELEKNKNSFYTHKVSPVDNVSELSELLKIKSEMKNLDSLSDSKSYTITKNSDGEIIYRKEYKGNSDLGENLFVTSDKIQVNDKNTEYKIEIKLNPRKKALTSLSIIAEQFKVEYERQFGIEENNHTVELRLKPGKSEESEELKSIRSKSFKAEDVISYDSYLRASHPVSGNPRAEVTLLYRTYFLNTGTIEVGLIEALNEVLQPYVDSQKIKTYYIQHYVSSLKNKDDLAYYAGYGTFLCAYEQGFYGEAFTAYQKMVASKFVLNTSDYPGAADAFINIGGLALDKEKFIKCAENQKYGERALKLATLYRLKDTVTRFETYRVFDTTGYSQSAYTKEQLKDAIETALEEGSES